MIVRASSRVGSSVGQLGQGGVGDPPALGGGDALLDHGQVVDPAGARRGRLGVGLGWGVRVDVAAELERDRRAHGTLAVADLDAAQVEDQLHGRADQGGVDLVAVAEQADHRLLGDLAVLGPQERLPQLGGAGQAGWRAGQEPLHGGLAGLGVLAVVVDALDPGAEQAVELVQVGGSAAGVQLDEELLADGAAGPLDLAAALWLAGLGVDKADAEHGQAALELAGGERRAVVDIERAGQAAGGEPSSQRGLQPQGVLGSSPAVADQGTGVVVDGGEQVGLAPGHDGAVQRVGGPQLVGRLGLEPAEGAQPAPLGGELAAQPDAAEVPLQGALVGAVPVALGDDDGDLRGGAAGLLALERHRQLQRARVDAGPADPGVGQQRAEPPGAPRADPAVKGAAAHAHPLTGRAEVVTLGQRADQRAALAGAQRRVGGLPDEGVAEQRDGLAAVVGGWHGGSLPVWSPGGRAAAEASAASGRLGRSGDTSPASIQGYHGAGKGALVLHSSRPPLAPEANSNGPVCAPSRRAAATAATPIASTAHSSGDPRGSETTALGSNQD